MALSVVLLLGGALRVTGYDWGRPLLLHPDEFAVADSAAGMCKRRSLDPAFYSRPNHVSIYSSAITYPIASRVAFGKSVTKSFGPEKPSFYFLSRLICALWGTLGILAAYLVMRRFHPTMGLYAALLFALFPPYVVHAHYATPDVPLTVLSTFLLAAVLRYMDDPRVRNLALACAVSALCVAEKYPGAVTTVIIGAAVWAVHGSRPKAALVESLRAAGLFFGFLFLISPFLFINAREVYAALQRESTSVHAGADGLSFWGNAEFYLADYVQEAGWWLIALGALGAVAAFRSQPRRAWPLLLGMVYWLALSTLGLHWNRWALPMQLTPLFMAAWGVHLIVEGVKQRSARMAVVAQALLVLSVVYLHGLRSAHAVVTRSMKDTRAVGLEFAHARGITKQNTFYEGYSPFRPGGLVRVTLPLARLRERGDYLILSSSVYNRFYKEKAKYKREVAWYDNVRTLPRIGTVKAGCPKLPNTWWGETQLAALYYALRNFDECLTGPTLEFYKLR